MGKYENENMGNWESGKLVNGKDGKWENVTALPGGW